MQMMQPVLQPETVQGLSSLLSVGQMEEIYREFAHYTRAKIAAFRGPCTAERVRIEAHSLRGSAGMLGAAALAELAAELEQEMVTGDTLNARAEVLDAALNQFLLALAAQGVQA